MTHPAQTEILGAIVAMPMTSKWKKVTHGSTGWVRSLVHELRRLRPGVEWTTRHIGGACHLYGRLRPSPLSVVPDLEVAA